MGSNAKVTNGVLIPALLICKDFKTFINCKAISGKIVKILFNDIEKFTKVLTALEGGLEPPTLWLTATRSSQLSY